MENTPQTSPLTDQNLSAVLLEWSNIFMRRSMHNFLKHAHSNNMSMAQMNVLTWLYHHGQSEVMRLEEVMQVSRPATSQMVERMVQQGLVTRAESPHDRRTRLVQLSEYGRQMVEESITSRQEWILQVTDTFNEEQKKMITCALEMLNQHAAAQGEECL